MDPAFVQMMMTCAVPDAFKKYLSDNNINDMDSFQLLASEERKVQVEIFDVAVAASVTLNAMGDKVAIKKLWRSCRTSVSKATSAAGSALLGDEPIPDENEKDIVAHWKHTHSFVIPESWLLIPTLQGKLWRSMAGVTAVIDILLVEKLRPVACISNDTGSEVVAMAGDVLRTRPVVLDSVTRVNDLFGRCRAWFMTAAYVCIRKQKFFDLQTALFASEKIYSFVNTLFFGQMAPCSFYANAWASTVHYFAETIRVSGSSLIDAINNTGSWQHFWIGWTPPTVVPGAVQPAGGGGGGGDMPKELYAEMQKLRSDCRHWQAIADANKDKAEKYMATGGMFGSGSSGSAPSGGKGGGKKGSFGGGGKGKKSGDKRGREPDRRDHRDSDRDRRDRR